MKLRPHLIHVDGLKLLRLLARRSLTGRLLWLALDFVLKWLLIL